MITKEMETETLMTVERNELLLKAGGSGCKDAQPASETKQASGRATRQKAIAMNFISSSVVSCFG